MIGAQRPPLIGQGPLVQRDGLVRAAGLLAGRRHAGPAGQRVRVIKAEPALLIGQGPLVQRDGHVGVVPLQPGRHAQVVGELPAGEIPVFGRLGQGPQQDVIHRGRKVLPPRRQPRRRLGQVRVQHRHALVPQERRLAGQQHERRARQRVLVRARVHRLAPDLLGRAVGRRAQEVPRSGLGSRRLPALGQPEVRQVHVIGPAGPRIHEHVGGLDVTVHQTDGMGGVQGRGHRGDDRGRPRDGQRAHPAHQRSRVAARHISHGDEQHAICFARFVHRDNVRVIHRGGGPGFTDETVPEFIIRRQRGRKDLECYLPRQPLILGPEYHRGSAVAYLFFQAIPGDPRTGGEIGQEPDGSRLLIAHRGPRNGRPGSRQAVLTKAGKSRPRATPS